MGEALVADATEVLIGIVTKSSTEEVRIRLAAWHGCDFVDLRVFAEFDGTEGEKRPTKRGVAVALHRLPEFVAAVQAALDEARRRGLVRGDRA
jgi:hypothetical protein